MKKIAIAFLAALALALTACGPANNGGDAGTTGDAGATTGDAGN